METSQLMMYRDEIAILSQIHTKYIKTLFWQNVEIFKVEPNGI